MTDRARPLCAAPRCRIPGRHGEDCPGDCRGCHPALAADGLRLCGHCAKRIGTDAVKLAELYDELELMLRPAGGTGGGHGQPGSASPPRDAVVAIRTEIRHVLVGWVRLIAEERGIRLPADRLDALGAFAARHADLLAASDYAADAADELRQLAGRAWGLAYPNGTRRLRVGPCPQCGGVGSGRWAIQRLPAGFIGPPNRSGMLIAVMREQDGGALPSEVFCDLGAEHRWTADQWRKLDRLVTKRRMAA